MAVSPAARAQGWRAPGCPRRAPRKSGHLSAGRAASASDSTLTGSRIWSTRHAKRAFVPAKARTARTPLLAACPRSCQRRLAPQQLPRLRERRCCRPQARELRSQTPALQPRADVHSRQSRRPGHGGGCDWQALGSPRCRPRPRELGRALRPVGRSLPHFSPLNPNGERQPEPSAPSGPRRPKRDPGPMARAVPGALAVATCAGSAPCPARRAEAGRSSRPSAFPTSPPRPPHAPAGGHGRGGPRGAHSRRRALPAGVRGFRFAMLEGRARV